VSPLPFADPLSIGEAPHHFESHPACPAPSRRAAQALGLPAGRAGWASAGSPTWLTNGKGLPAIVRDGSWSRGFPRRALALSVPDGLGPFGRLVCSKGRPPISRGGVGCEGSEASCSSRAAHPIAQPQNVRAKAAITINRKAAPLGGAAARDRRGTGSSIGLMGEVGAFAQLAGIVGEAR
jgi:hypothetical protein